MMNTKTLTMEQVERIARQERAEFIASLAKAVSAKLGKVFVSELRSSRENTLARLQAA